MVTLLTPREREVLTYLEKGYRREHVAKALCIAKATVRVYIHHILAKLKVANEKAAIAWARDQRKSSSLQPRVNGVPKSWALLTRREHEVLDQLVSDIEVLTDRQLAMKLVISVATVRKHLQNIYRKLGVAGRASVAVLAVKIRSALAPTRVM